MKKSLSVKKRQRQEIKRYRANVAKKEAFKRVKRDVRKTSEGTEGLAQLVKKFQKAVDKAAKSGAIHKNKAAREKARLMKIVRAKEAGKSVTKTVRKRAKARPRKALKSKGSSRKAK